MAQEEANGRLNLYDDTTPLQKTNSIDILLDGIRRKTRGADVREAIATALEVTYETAASEGNANMEVAKARGYANTLVERLDQMEQTDKSTAQDISVVSGQINNLIANAGNGTVPSELTDMRIGYDGTGFKTAGEAMRTQFLELNNDLDTAAENIGLVRPNLLNVEGQNRTNNGITWTFNLDGTVIVNGTATYNEYNKTTITLSAGEYYVSGAPLGSQTNTYHIMYTNGPSGASDVFFETGNGSTLILSKDTSIDFYIRIMNKTTVNNVVFKPMIAKKAYGRLPYLPYKKLFQISPPSSSNWSGAVANFIGDSITYGAYGNYVDGVKTRLGLSVARNYGIGGCLMASSSEDQRYRPVVNRWNEMEEADIIFVFAGTNDYSHQVPIGDATSTDITTFNGALNTIMDGLRNKYPDKLVIFSSILHRYNDNSLPIKVDSYREAIRERCEAKQFIFYDIYRNSGFDFVRGYYDKVLTTDGLHPNKKGAEILARKIAAFINSQ